MFLIEDLPGVATTTIHVECALSIAGSDPGAEVDLIQLVWNRPPPPCTVFGYFIVKDDTGPMELQETFDCGAGNTNDTFPFGVADGFHSISLDVQLGAQAATRLRVAIDGVGVVDKLADRDLPASDLTLRIGEETRTPSIDWIVHFDDVIVDLD